MWMLAILGAIGAALAAGRRVQRGPTPVRDELAAAREAGSFAELRDILWEEGGAVIEERQVLLHPYPVLNNADVVTSADRASVRRMAARDQLLDTAARGGAAWV